MPANIKTRTPHHLETAAEAMDDMEPEFRQLTGLVMALRIMGEAGDAIEPQAISSIARSAGSTLDDIGQAWRTVMTTLRSA